MRHLRRAVLQTTEPDQTRYYEDLRQIRMHQPECRPDPGSRPYRLNGASFQCVVCGENFIGNVVLLNEALPIHAQVGL